MPLTLGPTYLAPDAPSLSFSVTASTWWRMSKGHTMKEASLKNMNVYIGRSSGDVQQHADA